MPSLLTRLRSAAHSTRSALLPSGDVTSQVPILDMLAHNWYLGFTSFGGPAVHFQIFHNLFVEKYHWLDETSYQEMFALCQAFSGPASTKMHYGINVLHYGFWTGTAAFFLWSLPMAIAAFGLAVGISNIDEELPGPVYALLSGLNAATVGIIALAAVQLSKKAVTDTLTRILVFFGATAGMLYNSLWYFPVLMVAGGVSTVVWDLKLLQKGWKAVGPGESKAHGESTQSEPIELEARRQDTEANASGLHSRSTDRKDGPENVSVENEVQPEQPGLSPKGGAGSWRTGLVVLGAFFASFIVVMACRGAFSGQTRGFDVFANFYLAGTIIFGGGPVVIPLLREYVVEPGWVSPRDFILGLAITQAFPGPNFNFAVFLGTLAVGGTPIPQVVGAMIGFLGIFTPGIWMYTGMIGIWASVRKIHAVRACLRGIHAAAVGLVFTAVYRIFEIGYLDEDNQNGGSLSRDPWWVVIVATSFVGGMHFKLSPPLAVALGAVMGLIWYGVNFG